MSNIAYRVSTEDQNTARQEELPRNEWANNK